MHMGPEVQNSFKEVYRGNQLDQMVDRVKKLDMSDLAKHISWIPDMMPHGQFAILVTSGHLFKTVLHFWTHVNNIPVWE